MIIVPIGHTWRCNCCWYYVRMKWRMILPHDHVLLDSAPNIGPLTSRWELDKFKNCWNKSFRASKILTLLYQQVSNLLISQRDMSGPRLRALSNNRWSGGSLNRFLAEESEMSRSYLYSTELTALTKLVSLNSNIMVCTYIALSIAHFTAI
jgi:hypothetical protein